MGILYLVATPIGNLEDITLRALRILREVRLIAAEDTRTSRVLLQHYDIHTPLTGYHDHSGDRQAARLYDALSLGDVALISDAGMPGISDPGYELVQGALARGHPVVPIPGASAVITGLVASGLPTDRFIYMGFFPRKDSERRDWLRQWQSETRTVIVYESPHRLAETLALVVEVLGAARPVCVAREMTKLYEEFFRGGAAAALAHYQAHNPKGEVTLLIGGVSEAAQTWDEAQVRQALLAQMAAGESLSAAARSVAAAAGWQKKAVYQLGLDLQG
ncbi:MAG: 16S rRNA (cytidine(1402)-2'-O)-methyltransferase [Anaerolineae bacterium]|jgi:16S rRNA (cytidine1402-2'-O)-methyltransferase|nr:16S rRNA (cytidine(1402)-2'-O)-methyltransferase [Anaerolineae bacterium]